MMMYLKLNSRHSVRLKRIRHRPFNIPYAFSVTTLSPHNFLLKYFYCLSVVFLLYDLISQESLGKVLSTIVTNGLLCGDSLYTFLKTMATFQLAANLHKKATLCSYTRKFIIL